jgi:predicted NUDIX family NTP pyrophosphohydrolase
MPKRSAGLLMYRRTGPEAALEVLLGHPGGPFYARKDSGTWTIPKGELNEGEEPKLAALREFAEETGFSPNPRELIDLGTIKQRGGKLVHAWAFEGDWNPSELRCNTFTLEWPPRSGRLAEFPEIDRMQFFSLDSAREKLNPAQIEFLERLTRLV